MSAIALNTDNRALSQRVIELKKTWTATERLRRAQEGRRRLQQFLGMFGLDANCSNARRTA